MAEIMIFRIICRLLLALDWIKGAVIVVSFVGGVGL